MPAWPLLTWSASAFAPEIVYEIELLKLIAPTVWGLFIKIVRGAVMAEPKFAMLFANIGTPPVQLLALYQVPSASMLQVGAEMLNALSAGKASNPESSKRALAPAL